MKRPFATALPALLVLASIGCGRGGAPNGPDVTETERGGEPQAPTMPLGTATGWVEMDGERTELTHAAAVRVEVCPEDFATFVVLTDRPLDLADVVVPLTPPLDIRTTVDNRFQPDGEGTFAVISQRVGKPYLEVGRIRPGGVDGFNGPAVLADIRPEIRLETDELIEGGWKGRTDGRNWVGGPATWDFAFAAEISDVWLAGEVLPPDGGRPGVVVRSYLDSDSADPTMRDAEIVGGRSNGERAMVGWRTENGGEGFFFLESEAPVEEGGAPDWRIVAKVPCIRLD